MKNEQTRPYIMIGLTAFAVIAASLLAGFLIFNFSMVWAALSKLASILMPFIIGCVIAYLLSPMYNFLLRNLDYKLCRTGPLKEKGHGLCVALSLVFSIAFTLLVVSGLVAMVIPGFVSSLSNIVNSASLYTDRINEWVNSLFADSPETAQALENVLDSSSAELTKSVQNLLPNLQSISRGLGSGVSNVFSSLLSGVLVVFGFAKNLLVGFIVAAYLLLGKGPMIAHAKRLVYGLFPLKTANELVGEMRFIHQVFGGFIRGKLVDSLLIGMLCFIGTSLLQMPYAMLVSVIIGVTNIIPFFGPFIGAIPSALLILLNSPIKCVTFVIFVVALQQFDGNILGPKILGETTGLSSFWVLFSILLFGGLFGVVGMIIGVPVFAVLVSMLERFLSSRLRRKTLSVAEEDYTNLEHVVPKEDGSYEYPKLPDPTVREE